MKIAPLGWYRAFDDNGDPLAGGKLYTYDAGTSTPKATYTDKSGNTPNANPVILDANGYADVWLDAGGYKFVLKDSNDVLIRTVDNIDGGSATGFASAVVTKSSSFSLSINEQNNVVVCTSALTISLLPVGTAGDGYAAMIINTSVGNVTLDGDGSETINGSATFVIPTGQSITLHTDGLTWYAATGMLNDASVVTAKLASNAVTTIKITDANVTTAKLADNAVTTVKITDGNVTGAKLAATAVVAGSYLNTNLTVDAQGRITAAASSVPFVSTQQTITAGGALTLAHSLGAKPSSVTCTLVCTTIDANYAVSDELELGYLSPSQGTTAYGVSVVKDATNLNIRFGSNASTFAALNKTTGGSANLTNSSWKAVFRAWP